MPLGCSGCGHDNVKLFMVELIWCMMGTMEGAAGHRENNSEFVWQWRDCFMFVCGCVCVWNSESENAFFPVRGGFNKPWKTVKGRNTEWWQSCDDSRREIKKPLVLQQLIPCNTFSKLCPTPAVEIKGVQHLWEPLQSDLSSLTSSPQSLARLLNKAFQIWSPVARCPQCVDYVLHFSLTYKQMKTYRALCEETSSFADKVALPCAALQNIEF